MEHGVDGRHMGFQIMSNPAMNHVCHEVKGNRIHPHHNQRKTKPFHFEDIEDQKEYAHHDQHPTGAEDGPSGCPDPFDDG